MTDTNKGKVVLVKFFSASEESTLHLQEAQTWHGIYLPELTTGRQLRCVSLPTVPVLLHVSQVYILWECAFYSRNVIFSSPYCPNLSTSSCRRFYIDYYLLLSFIFKIFKKGIRYWPEPGFQSSWFFTQAHSDEILLLDLGFVKLDEWCLMAEQVKVKRLVDNLLCNYLLSSSSVNLPLIFIY